nr:hypothetical protein [Saprospiraceae bacterium]
MRLALAILWLAMPIVAIAQEPAYLHYGVSDGLPSSLVYCIEQDSMGVMWLGTDKGLVRFDGSRFRTFSIKDGLPDNEVLNMYSDSYGRLWLSCFRNKPCYEKHGEIFTEADDPMLKGLDMNAGTFVFGEDNSGTLWMTGGVTGLGKVSGNEASYFDKQHMFGSKPIFNTLNSIWSLNNRVFASSNSKIFRISNRGTATPIFDFPLEMGLLDVVSIGVSGNRLLCSMKEGLYLMEYVGDELRIIAQ